MKKIVGVVTSTRAEYGLLKPVIKKLKENKNFDVRIIVTGAHLSSDFGSTYKEIEADGNKIDKKIEMLISSDTPSAISKSMGLAMIGFADCFDSLKPDLLIILGDRYEMLAVASTAMNYRIPIAHLHGGEITEGAIDDAIRHAITKLSYLHFTSTKNYRQRVIQLGESPDRVFCVGATGVENALNEKLMTKRELEESINFDLNKPYAVVTFHPVTLEKDNSEEKMKQLLSACEEFKNLNFIFTKANADANGRIINKMLEDYVRGKENAVVFESLGMVRYLSSLKYSSFVLGNSSSGILEAPSFKIPTINIGDRQKGRIQAESIINCRANKKEIVKSIKKALSEEFKKEIKNVENPYGNGDTSTKIVDIIEEFVLNEKIDLKKKFYNILK